MDLVELINHPEQMDRDTLYELRSQLALHPYFQTVRLLMLQNLYLLHDPTFDEELRRAAIYITDRRKLFDLVEAAHYQLQADKREAQSSKIKAESSENRTMALIDTFLDSIPADEPEEKKRNDVLHQKMLLSTMSPICWRTRKISPLRRHHRCKDKTS